MTSGCRSWKPPGSQCDSQNDDSATSGWEAQHVSAYAAMHPWEVLGHAWGVTRGVANLRPRASHVRFTALRDCAEFDH